MTEIIRFTLRNLFPFLNWWPLVNRETLRADLIAGLTGAVIVLPQGVAFAMIAGLPPEYGLYTAIITPVIAALFGSSRHLVSGPTTAISIVVFAAISPLAEPGSADFVRLALTLTFMAGAVQLAFGLARLGALVNFVSHSVVVGFTAGAAVLIATSQVKHVLGIGLPSGSDFLHTWLHLGSHLWDTNVYVLAVAGTTLVSAILLRKYRPRWPGMLLAMIIGSLLSLGLDGAQHGVSLVGQLPAQLPPLSSPDFSRATIKSLASNAFAIALLGLIEAVSIARAIATRSHQRIDGNQEFIGQGLSNVVGSFFSSYAGSGSFTRSGINFQVGARTPLAAIFAAGLLAVILVTIAPLTAYLPIPAMGGVILMVAYNLIDFHHIRKLLRLGPSEVAVLATTFFATLFLELEFAIYLGVFLSLTLYLNRTSKPRIVELVPDPDDSKRKLTNIAHKPLAACPQLKVVRIDGSLFFGAVNHVAEKLQKFGEESPGQRHILIVANGINFIDAAGAEALVAESKRRRALGGGLYLSGLKEPVREFLERGGFTEELGHGNVFVSKYDAMSDIFERLSRDICSRCEARVFLECHVLARNNLKEARRRANAESAAA
ncbi:MAG: SulP family inorganic anion transporter [Thiohalobacteraceae bacterium]|nr:SulP family inorganic anion transporter [Gammaproteobacteria bacterium]